MEISTAQESNTAARMIVVLEVTRLHIVAGQTILKELWNNDKQIECYWDGRAPWMKHVWTKGGCILHQKGIIRESFFSLVRVWYRIWDTLDLIYNIFVTMLRLFHFVCFSIFSFEKIVCHYPALFFSTKNDESFITKLVFWITFSLVSGCLMSIGIRQWACGHCLIVVMTAQICSPRGGPRSSVPGLGSSSQFFVLGLGGTPEIKLKWLLC